MNDLGGGAARICTRQPMLSVVHADALARSPIEELLGQEAVGGAATFVVFGGTAGVLAVSA